jgi:hypothetical protein
MQIRPEEIASVLRKEIESFDYSLEMGSAPSWRSVTGSRASTASRT